MLDSQQLESEIRGLLELSSEHEIVAERLSQKYAEVDLEQPVIESLAVFFLKSGNAAAFAQFCLKRIEKDLALPWGHFAAALFQLADASHESISAPLKNSLREGAEEKMGLSQLARCKDLDASFPDLESLRAQNRRRHQDDYQEKKIELLSQVEMLRTQEMEEEEERALLQLLRLFPKDNNLAHQHEELRERKAIRILEAKLQSNETPWDAGDQILLEPEERAALDKILSSMHLQWAAHGFDEELGHDFATALLMWDYAEGALDFLPDQSRTPRVIWSRLEAQVMARHFLNLLGEIDRVENITAPDPEATFALLYIKAIALWGMGHRFAAVEIMEGIASHRPNYRSATTLLHLWKDGPR